MSANEELSNKLSIDRVNNRCRNSGYDDTIVSRQSLSRNVGHSGELRTYASTSKSTLERLMKWFSVSKLGNLQKHFCRLRVCDHCSIGNRFRRIAISPFSSSLLAFFLKVFHHDARSRFEGGDVAFCDVEGIACCGAATADA